MGHPTVFQNGVKGTLVGPNVNVELDPDNATIEVSAGKARVKPGVFGLVATYAGTWRTGSGAPSNGTGIDGDLYLRTSNGDIYLRAGGVYGVVGNLTGPAGATGAAGTNGITWSHGSGAPGGGGAVGDLYLRTDTNDVYYYDGGGWAIITNLTGATGAAGSNGTNGTNASAGFIFTYKDDPSGGLASGKISITSSSTSYLMINTWFLDKNGNNLAPMLAELVTGTRFRLSSLDGARWVYGWLCTTIGNSGDAPYGLGAGQVTEWATVASSTSGGGTLPIDGEDVILEFLGETEYIPHATSDYHVRYESKIIWDTESGGATIYLPDAAKNKGKVITFIASGPYGGSVLTVGTDGGTIHGPTTLTIPAASSYVSDGVGWYAFGWTSGAA